MRIPHAAVAALGALVLSAAAGAQSHQAPGGQHKPDHMQHRFDDPERYSKDFDDPSRDAWQMPDRVIAALDVGPGQVIADIGAGTGYFSVRLARSSARPTVYAVDIEPKMVAFLEARAAKEGLANLRPVQASAEGANLPGPADTIVIVDTFHHIPSRVAYFRRLASSLKPGGQLAIIDFRKDAPQGPPVEFRFTAEEIAAELAQAGYTLAARHDFLPRQHFLVFRR